MGLDKQNLSGSIWIQIVWHSERCYSWRILLKKAKKSADGKEMYLIV